jgi:hypothetical protein
MTNTSWTVSGQYYETCSCDFVCPCILQQMAVQPSKGTCTFAMGYQIEKGSFGATSLDGLGFIVLGMTPGEMINGGWSVGLVIDDRATPEQRDAITAIASGSAGGPMAGLAGLIGNFLGVESAPISFTSSGAEWSVKAGKLAEIGGRPAMGINPDVSVPMQLSNTGHPAAETVNLAFPTTSHVSALGLSWDDDSGRNSGQYAPFSWRSA